MKTICAVRVPFVRNIKEGKSSVSFHIRFDEIEGLLPFLIGLPCLLAMKSLPNFQFNNHSIIIHRTVYCLQLLKMSAHHEPPLICKVTHQRPLRKFNESRNDSRLTYNPINNGSRQRVAQNEYVTPTVSKTLLSSSHSEPLTMLYSKKVHAQLGHAVATKMKPFSREVHKWILSYTDLIDQVIAQCTCPLPSMPSPGPVCSTCLTSETIRTNVSIDALCF